MSSQSSILVLMLFIGCAISSTMAATCTFDTANFIVTSDIQSLSNDIANNNFNPQLQDPLPLDAGATQSFSLGTTVFCLANNFLFENTHVALSDIAFGANDIVSQCCASTNCQGGQFTVTGDDKITTILSVQPGGTSC